VSSTEFTVTGETLLLGGVVEATTVVAGVETTGGRRRDVRRTTGPRFR
jgi:hypothetical protein